MPIEDAIPFLSRNFDQFVEMMKKKLAVVKQWIPPDSKTTYLLNLLADGRRLTVAELEEVSQYITTLLNRTKGPEPEEPQGVGRADNGWQTHQPNNDYDPRIPERLLSSERPSNVLPPARSEPLLPPPTLQKGDYSGGLQGVNKNKEVEHKGVGGLYQQRYMESSNPTAGSSSASGINFDNPAVKRALEDLLRSSKSSAPPANRGLLF